MDGDVPRAASCGVCISQLIRFAGVSGHVADFDARGGLLAARLLSQGYRYHKLRGAFCGFCGRHSDLVSEFGVELGSLLWQGLSESEFCGDLVYLFGKVYACGGFGAQFRRIIFRYRKIGCSMDVVRRAACMVVGPVTVGGFASLFGCAPAGWASDSVVVPTWGLT